MNTFTQGVPTTTSECPRPWFMQGALQAVSLHRADSFQGDHSLHLQQQQPLHQTQQHVNAVPSHTQSSHMTIPQTLNSHDAHLRVPSRPPSIHNQGRIPSPAQVGLPRAMGHTVQSHPYHEQSPMSGNHINHTQQEAPRVPSRSQPDQRIPSPVQHGLPSMPSHSLHDQPRVPSRSHLDQVRIPSPAQHDIADMASHSHHPQARMPHSHIEASNHHSDQSRVHSQSPHDHHPSVSSHVTHHEQSRLVSHTPHDQSQMPSHSQHDQSQMPSHSQHDQSQIPSHDHSQMPSHDQSQIQSHSQHEQVQMPARTQQEQAHLPNHSQPDQSQLQGQGQHKPAQMPSHTSHEQSRMASHSSHEQPRMPSHSQHEQTQQMQMPARTQHDQSQHEQPRAPSHSQHDTQRQISGHADGNAHGNQTAALDLLHSQAEHGGFDLHGMSETFRQMAKQHGALGPAAPSEYFPLTVPLAGMGQSLATQFHKPTMARNPYFNNPAYKPTETGMMKCNFCTDVFANALQLQTHMIAHYEMAIRSLPGNPFGDLRQTVKTEKDLLAGADLSLKQSAGHIGAGNNEVAMDTSSTGTPNTSLTETTKTPKPIAEKKHECATCAKRFTRTDHLRRHVMKIHPEVMQQASASGMVTPQLNQIRNDPPTITAKKTDGPHQCFICGKRFKRSDHLKRHMTKAHPDLLPTEATRSLFMKFDIHAMYGDAGPPLKSPKPKSPFVPNYTEAEKQEKRHVCITCEKRFKRQDHLKRHITIHSDEKPFDCVLCGKGFRREHHVKRHERTHTGEKPYECVTCGKKFARIDHMKKHNKSHLFDGIRKPGQKLNQSLSAMDVSVPVSVPVSEPLTFFDDIRKPLQKLNPVLPSVTMATSESLAMCAPLPTTCMAGGI